MVEDAGFITRQSRNAVSETLQRLEGALASRGFMVFCRIDHGAAAAAIGETCRRAPCCSTATRRSALPPWRASRRWPSICRRSCWCGRTMPAGVGHLDRRRLFLRHDLRPPGGAAAAAQIDAYDTRLTQVVAHAIE